MFRKSAIRPDIQRRFGCLPEAPPSIRVFDALNAPTKTGKEIRAAGFIHNVLEDLAQPIEFFIAAIGVDEFDGGFQIVRYRGNLFFPPRVGIIVSDGLTAAIEDRGMQILKFLH